MQVDEFEWDAFICHATEDKDYFVRELAHQLVGRGVQVWYDEFTLKVGDSLQQAITKGVLKSRYGIVVLSPRFLEKEWPQKELKVLLQRDSRNVKVILPVWLDIGYEEIARYLPLLADYFATKAEYGMEKVVNDLTTILKPC